MSQSQIKNKFGDKALQVKKVKNIKIGKDKAVWVKNDTNIPNEKKVPCSAGGVSVLPICAKCCTKMDIDKVGTVEMNKSKENLQVAPEKIPSPLLKDIKFDPSAMEPLPLNIPCEKPDAKPTKVIYSQISDLCLRDKQRIAELTEEVSRYNKYKESNANEMNSLRSKLKESENKIMILKANEHTKLTYLSNMERKHNEEEQKMKANLSELSYLLVEMHKQKEITNEKVRAVKIQAQKLTEALQKTYDEKLCIEKLFKNANEELRLVRHAKDKLAKQLSLINNKQNKREAKSCQCPEEEPIIDVGQTKKVEDDVDRTEEIKLVVKTKPVVETSDFQILSELFFTKSSICQQDESLHLVQGHIANKYVNFDDILIN